MPEILNRLRTTIKLVRDTRASVALNHAGCLDVYSSKSIATIGKSGLTGTIRDSREVRTVAEIDRFQEANAAYAANFDKGNLPVPPGRRLAVVACMDARLDPAKALGLNDGDAHVIRNAGGRVADAVRSLVISQQLLGTREVAIVHHTDCGMLTFNDDQLRRKLHDELHADTDMDFHAFSDLEQSVRDDIAAVKSSPLLLREVVVRGFIYDVKTGRIHEVA
jgi:carbonic anhydrase